MKVVDVRCSGCAAPISVSERARFVTCRFCNAQLSIQDAGPSSLIPVTENTAEDTHEGARSVRLVQLQAELERLDREFQLAKAAMQSTDKYGRKSSPSVRAGIFILVIGGAFVSLWIAFAISMGAPIFFPLFGMVFLLALVGAAMGTMAAAKRLGASKEEYTRRRNQLLREIEREHLAFQASPDY